MPNYKKKTHHIASPKGKKAIPKKKTEENNIPMHPHKSKRADADLSKTKVRVVNGKKLENKRRARFVFYSIAAVIIVVASLSFLLPAGLFENISNTVALIGGGKYPVEIFGTNTLDCEKQNGYYYVLTDTNLYAYSNGGKQLLSVPHGLSKPVLKTSETRALLYDQGGKTLSIYTLQKKVISLESEMPIICAALSRNGGYAVATKAKDYASTVKVYSKSGKTLYEWNSAKDIVNNVALSPYNKRLVVSTLNSSGAKAVSKLMVFNFKSANPIHSIDLGENAAYELSVNTSGFSVITQNEYKYISFSCYKQKNISSDFELNMFRKTPSGVLLVFNRSNDRSDNKIMIVSPYGNKKSEISYKGIINDIALSKGHIYCISDIKAEIINKKGELLKTAPAEYGCRRIAVIGNNALAEITDNEIIKISVNDKG